MLEVSNLSRTGLQPASFTVATGECVAVHGPSGAGKTLLMRAIADLDPSEGRVSLDGLDREAVSGPEWRRQVVYLPAEPGWWADSIGEHFPTWGNAVPLLARLGLPEDARNWAVSRCSTGERQRLALIRALTAEPRVLLLDEPTSALDSARVSVVEALIAERVAGGLSVLWVTHDDVQAKAVARRWLSVEAGQVREVAAP